MVRKTHTTDRKHSREAIDLVHAIILKLEEIPDGCAELFPFNNRYQIVVCFYDRATILKILHEEITVNLEFEYRITYGTGQVFDRKGPYRIEVSKEEYMKIVDAVMNDIPLMNIEGIDEIIEKMTNYVKDIDGCYNMDGTLRRSQLKKPRVISDLEFSIYRLE